MTGRVRVRSLGEDFQLSDRNSPSGGEAIRLQTVLTNEVDMHARPAARHNRVILAVIIAVVAGAIGLWYVATHLARNRLGLGQAKTGTTGYAGDTVDQSIGPLVTTYRRSVEAQPGKRGALFEKTAIEIGAMSLSQTVKESQILGWFGQPDFIGGSGNQKTLVYKYSLAQPNDNAVWFELRTGTVFRVSFAATNEPPSDAGRKAGQEPISPAGR